MQGARIKVNFFQKQIEFVAQFKSRLEGVLQLTKDTIKTERSIKIQTNLQKIEELLKTEIKKEANEVKRTKRIVSSQQDEGEIERRIIFNSLDSKIDELNDRLYVAEECVQNAQMLKKKNDAVNKDPNGNYKMSNIKTFKKSKEQKVIQNYIHSRARLKNQIKRFISTAFDENEEEENTGHQAFLDKTLSIKNAGLGFRELRQELVQRKNREYRSVQKYPSKYLSVKELKKNKPKLLLQAMLSDPALQPIIDDSINDLTNFTKVSNKRITLHNSMLTNAQERKQTNTVWEFLEHRKEELTVEESIAKLELDAVKLNQVYEERMLSLKDFEQLQTLKKHQLVISKQWPSKRILGFSPPSKEYRSQEKKRKRSVNQGRKIPYEVEANKKNDSHPHTNDSGSALGRR